MKRKGRDIPDMAFLYVKYLTCSLFIASGEFIHHGIVVRGIIASYMSNLEIINT